MRSMFDENEAGGTPALLVKHANSCPRFPACLLEMLSIFKDEGSKCLTFGCESGAGILGCVSNFDLDFSDFVNLVL